MPDIDDQVSLVKASLERLRHCNPKAKFAEQSTRKWRGQFPLPQLIDEYFAAPGPVEAIVPCVWNPAVLCSFKSVNKWASPRTKLFSSELQERANPIVIIEGEFDKIFWCDGREPLCPVRWRW